MALQVAEVALHHREAGEVEAFSPGHGLGVLVQPDDPASPLQNAPGVPRPAQGGVHVHPPGPDGEEV